MLKKKIVELIKKHCKDFNAGLHCFISNEDHIVSKTYMTLVMCENIRFRHYLARLHRKTFCYSKSEEMLKLSIRLVIHYLKYGSVAPVSLRRSHDSYLDSATPFKLR
jgi:IS1 family transposase